MRTRLPWFERTPNVRPAKIGTMPALVQVHGADVGRIEPGLLIRIREAENGPWTRVLVQRVLPGGHFQADRC